MKISEIINEGHTDIVARLYVSKEPSEEHDKLLNAEVHTFKKKNREYYDSYFKDWYDKDITPVFTKPVDKMQPKYDTNPGEGKIQSPGYRGLNYSKKSAGLKFDKNTQCYQPDMTRQVAAQAYDNYRSSRSLT